MVVHIDRLQELVHGALIEHLRHAHMCGGHRERLTCEINALTFVAVLSQSLTHDPANVTVMGALPEVTCTIFDML